MVRVLFAWLLPLCLCAAPSLQVTLESRGLKGALSGTAIVSCDGGEVVDEASFVMGTVPLSVTCTGTSSQSEVRIINGKRSQLSTVLSSYSFNVPEGAELAPITVRAGKQLLSSGALSVKQQTVEEARGFSLDSRVEKLTEGSLYPGSRLRFIYRITVQDSVESSYSDLPLLEAKGFKKLGEVQMSQGYQGSSFVKEFSQEVEALAPGTYTFEAGCVDLRRVQEDIFGRRLSTGALVRASSSPLQVDVLAFPEAGKPANFAGFIGPCTLTDSCRRPDKLAIGDKIELSLSFEGPNLHTLKMPNLSHLSNQFKIGDLPRIEDVRSKKIFTFELRPLLVSCTEIPAISIAVFDPTTATYSQLSSKCIPIQVEGGALPTKPEPVPVQQVLKPLDSLFTLPCDAYADECIKKAQAALTNSERQKFLNEALLAYSKLPDSPTCFLARGNCCYWLGSYVLSLWYFREAVKGLDCARSLELAQKKCGLGPDDRSSALFETCLFATLLEGTCCRQEPSQTSPLVGKSIKAGSLVKVLAISKDWVRVPEGWLPAELVLLEAGSGER